MFSTEWETSKRQYDIIHERNVAIPVRAGFTLDCDILRPDSTEKFPAILCLFPFYKEDQIKSIMPVAVCPELVSIEGGDYNFYVRRGGVLFKAGSRFAVRIKAADKDDGPADFLDSHGLGHLWRETPAEITVYHNNRYSPHLFADYQGKPDRGVYGGDSHPSPAVADEDAVMTGNRDTHERNT